MVTNKVFVAHERSDNGLDFDDKWRGEGPAQARALWPPTRPEGAAVVDIKLQVVVVPVSDVDRAKAFYESVG
jgi:hypothetical protein